jgi:hypothetical protein
MPIERAVLILSASVLALASAVRTAPAQSTPINLQLDVQPSASFLAGNVTRVSYVVANEARSTDRLFEFAVRSPVPVWRIEVPRPSTQYLGATQEGRDNVAAWGWLDDMPRPGEASPVLAYEAIGLPGIVSYRALRYFGVRQARPGESDHPELYFDKAGAEHTVGKTVGVVSLPIDLRPATLSRRLGKLLDEACALKWIDDATVCRSLRGNARPSARALRAFHHELVAQRGRAVKEPAFALLQPNVEFLLSKL